MIRFPVVPSRLNALARAAPTLRIQAAETIFVVTSTIRAAERPLSYSPVRSIFSAEERLEQTIGSLRSIRERAPEALVLLLENSLLQASDVDALRSECDWLVPFASDPEAASLRDGPYKGAGELHMLVAMEPCLRHFAYRRLFKLSGRYQLSDQFDLGAFPLERFGLLLRDDTYSTRLYSVPKRLEQRYFDELRRVLRLAKRGATIEAEILRRAPHDEIGLLPFLGVSGLFATNGASISE